MGCGLEKLCREAWVVLISYRLNIPKKYHLKFFFKIKLCFYQSFKLVLDPPGRIGHIAATLMLVNFKIKLGKVLIRSGCVKVDTLG